MPSDMMVSVLSAALSRKNATRVAPVPLTQHEVPPFSCPLTVAPLAGALNHTSSAPAPGAAVAVVGVGVGVIVGVGVTVVTGGGVGVTVGVGVGGGVGGAVCWVWALLPECVDRSLRTFSRVV